MMSEIDNECIFADSWRCYKGFRLRDSEYGPALILPSRRIREAARFMRREGILRIEINESIGFESDDLSALGLFSFIEGLEIIHHKVKDISIIHELDNLTDLSIQTYCRTPIDFAKFPRLRRCRIIWRPGAESVFESRGLEWLFLDYYKPKGVSGIRNLTRLRSLTITNGPIEDISPVFSLRTLDELRLIYLRRLKRVRGIENLKGLWELEISKCPAMESLSGIEQLTKLTLLELDGSWRIADFDGLSELSRLRILYLCNMGEIPSLSFLRKLKRLERFYAWENTNVVDGDLSPLLELGHLREARLMNRSHYSPTPDEIQRQIGNI